MLDLRKWCTTVLLALFVVAASPAMSQSSASEQAPDTVYAPININTASVEELAGHLIGVGPAKAEAIVAWREQNNGFKHIEELEHVKGIGSATVEKNRSRMTIE